MSIARCVRPPERLALKVSRKSSGRTPSTGIIKLSRLSSSEMGEGAGVGVGVAPGGSCGVVISEGVAVKGAVKTGSDPVSARLIGACAVIAPGASISGASKNMANQTRLMRAIARFIDSTGACVSDRIGALAPFTIGESYLRGVEKGV